MLVIKTLKDKISDFLSSNTSFCSQLYGIQLPKGNFSKTLPVSLSADCGILGMYNFATTKIVSPGVFSYA